MFCLESCIFTVIAKHTSPIYSSCLSNVRSMLAKFVDGGLELNQHRLNTWCCREWLILPGIILWPHRANFFNVRSTIAIVCVGGRKILSASGSNLERNSGEVTPILVDRKRRPRVLDLIVSRDNVIHNEHETLNQRRLNVGPASTTLSQHTTSQVCYVAHVKSRSNLLRLFPGGVADDKTLTT